MMVSKESLRLKIGRVVMAVFFSLCCASISYASGIFASDPCNSAYRETLRAQAWLNAQAEITQNQNLIFKTDSVLEYTCFNRYLNELADHSKPSGPDQFFVGTDRWGIAPADLPAAMDRLSPPPLNAYLGANFGHTFLGGRGPLPPAMGPSPGPSSGPSSGALPGSIPVSGGVLPIVTQVTPGDYNCSAMNDIWPVAKCMDFIDNPDKDGFFTFAEYAADPDDKRYLPTQCPKTADFQAMINKADANPGVGSVDTYFHLLYPSGGACASSSLPAGQSTKVPTGLTVESGSATYAEHVCVVPGCRYEYTSDKCVN